MADIKLLTDEEVSGTTLGPTHGVAQARINQVIQAVNDMDTPSEIEYTPTTSADWPPTAPTSVQAALDSLAAQTSNEAVAICLQLPVQTDEAEVTGDLNGVASKQFVPTEVVLEVTAVDGTVAADGTINVGTSTGGDDILSAQALTGLTTVGTTRRIPLSEATTDIAADATLYANVESNDTTVTTLELSVHIYGRQL